MLTNSTESISDRINCGLIFVYNIVMVLKYNICTRGAS